MEPKSIEEYLAMQKSVTEIEPRLLPAGIEVIPPQPMQVRMKFVDTRAAHPQVANVFCILAPKDSPADIAGVMTDHLKRNDEQVQKALVKKLQSGPKAEE